MRSNTSACQTAVESRSKPPFGNFGTMEKFINTDDFGVTYVA
jgi:hypothetical protein